MIEALYYIEKKNSWIKEVWVTTDNMWYRYGLERQGRYDENPTALRYKCQSMRKLGSKMVIKESNESIYKTKTGLDKKNIHFIH